MNPNRIKIRAKLKSPLPPQLQPQLLVYYGSVTCTATKANRKKCENYAYYEGLLCGVHSKSKVPLLKDPHAKARKAIQLAEHEALIEGVAAENRDAGRVGHISMVKMRMMKTTPLKPGNTNIYPNYRDGFKKDGLGIPSLSPKSMGPIAHGQPGLPPSKNLENLHQGNKCFHEELNDDGDPAMVFYERQLEMYNDAVPWRHKFDKYKELAAPSRNKNIAKYSVWVDTDGTECHLTYFESRQVYCALYEKHAHNNPDYLKLQGMLSEGYNLQICGYDAYNEIIPTEQEFEKYYKDTSRPFGHEMVLCAMLLGFRPWIKHITLSAIKDYVI